MKNEFPDFFEAIKCDFKTQVLLDIPVFPLNVVHYWTHFILAQTLYNISFAVMGAPPDNPFLSTYSQHTNQYCSTSYTKHLNG